MTLGAQTSTLPASSATIDVWTFALDVPEAVSAGLDALLSPRERVRGDRFLHAHDARRFRVAHARLREILASYLAVAPAAIAFGEGTHGKPHVSGPETSLRFNLSHSGALAAVAVTQGGEVGVDVEHMRPVDDTGLEGVLSPREQQALAALAGSERHEAFYRCWTRKEALLKAYGRGLDVPLDSFDVPVGREPDAVVAFAGGQTGGTRAWRIVSFVPAPGYAGAVAVGADPSGRNAEVRWRTWPEGG